MKRFELKILTFFSFCLIFLLFAITAKSFAIGKSTSMGDMQTVVYSGPFDVARNPALLPLQDKTNSTGLFYTYISHYPGCSSRSQEQNIRSGPPSSTFEIHADSSIKQDDPDIKAMSGHIANSTKTGSTAFGFAITDNGNNQYLVTKRKSIVESEGQDTVNNRMLYNYRDEDSEITEFNPAFISSIGTNISNSSFIGFQLIAGYSNKIEKKKAYGIDYLDIIPISPTPPTFNEESEKETKRISAELGFGYLYRNNNNQLGLLIRSGEVAWTEKSLEVTRYKINPPPSGTFTADSTVKTNVRYVNGPSIVAGAYKKLNPFFAIAFECGIKFESSFVDTDLVYNQDINMVEEEKSVSNIKNTYIMKAGLELNFSKSLTFTSGVGYIEGSFETYRYRVKGTSEESVVGIYKTKRAFITLGIQYVISNNMTIDLLAAGNGYRDNVSFRVRNRDTTSNVYSELRAKQKEEGVFAYTGLGVTLSL